jgi:peptidoglycan/LPS O-acetylase OafA/YrhL
MTRRTVAPVPFETKRFFRPELDVLRFCAFFLVFLNHYIPDDAPPILLAVREGGAFGVSIFFALSAFLITELLFREQSAKGSIDFKAFYFRRTLRIWPLYFLALLICLIASRLQSFIPAVTVRQLMPFLILCGNWPAVTNFYILPAGFGVLWSISVEEQFYLIWPALVRGSRAALPWVLLGIWVTSQVFIFGLNLNAAPYYKAWFNTFAQMQYFAIGAAVSVLMRGQVPQLKGAIRLLLILSGLTLFAVFNRPESATVYVPYLTAGIGAAVILIGFLGTPVPRSAAWLCHLGKISYGLYVYHNFVLVMLHHAFRHGLACIIRENPFRDFALGMSLTILIAHLSYTYFEKPFLRLKERFEVIRSRAA